MSLKLTPEQKEEFELLNIVYQNMSKDIQSPRYRDLLSIKSEHQYCGSCLKGL